MHAAVVTAFNQLIAQKDEFLPGMKLAMERALAGSIQRFIPRRSLCPSSSS